MTASGQTGLNACFVHLTLLVNEKSGICKHAGTRKGPGGHTLLKGTGQNFNYVKIHTLEFRGSVAFLLHQILTDHIFRIASAITLDINTSQISSIDSVTAGFIITN